MLIIFSYSNSDEGSHYHEASGNPKVLVRGRYGARNPETQKIDETVYTAGPRGLVYLFPLTYKID